MLIAIFLLAALGPAYLAWLAFGRKTRLPVRAANLPPIDLIVAVRDEAGLIEDKLRNLESLDYPPDKLKIFVVDGGSLDGTVEIARRHAGRRFPMVLLENANGGKTAQLNAALGLSKAPWVLVTDADARMAPDALRTMAEAAESSKDIGAVGTTIDRESGHALDRLYWKILNRLWRLESARGCASIVTGPCYLFRRAMVSEYPGDVVADDVFVALAAAASGHRVECVPAGVVELRCPESLLQFAFHKARKARAYLREIVRFVPRIGSMKGAPRIVYVWRALQLVLAPPAAAFLAVAVAARPAGALPAALGAAAGLAFAAALRPVRVFLRLSALGSILSLVLMVVLLASPFWRQTACFPKVGRGARWE